MENRAEVARGWEEGVTINGQHKGMFFLYPDYGGGYRNLCAKIHRTAHQMGKMIILPYSTFKKIK